MKFTRVSLSLMECWRATCLSLFFFCIRSCLPHLSFYFLGECCFWLWVNLFLFLGWNCTWFFLFSFGRCFFCWFYCFLNIVRASVVFCKVSISMVVHWWRRGYWIIVSLICLVLAIKYKFFYFPAFCTSNYILIK